MAFKHPKHSTVEYCIPVGESNLDLDQQRNCKGADVYKEKKQKYKERREREKNNLKKVEC